VLAATKADLLPKSASPARLENWVRRRAKAGGLTVLDSVRFVGAPARFGVSSLAAQLEALSRQRSGAEVWVVGAQNAGKSSLINALSAHYYGDAFRAGPVASHVPGTTLGLVRLEALLPGGRSVVDTPGLLHTHALSARLLPDEARMVLPRRPLRPRTFRVSPGAAVTVGALFRVEVVGSPGATRTSDTCRICGAPRRTSLTMPTVSPVAPKAIAANVNQLSEARPFFSSTR
jgi:ribosome biogenesis GTPase A